MLDNKLLLSAILSVFLFLFAIYEHNLKIAFIILLVGTSLVVLYIKEQRIKKCEENCYKTGNETQLTI